MDTLITLNLIGYAAVLVAGLVLGTLFGRGVLADLTGAMHALNSRVLALETTLHVRGANAQTAVVSSTAAIKSHAEATAKLAAAIETHAASQATAGATPSKKS